MLKERHKGLYLSLVFNEVIDGFSSYYCLKPIIQMTLLSLLHRKNAYQMRHEFFLIPHWLYKNLIGINPDTCHFQTLGFKYTLSIFLVEIFL